MKIFGIFALAVMALVVTGGMVAAYGFRNEAVQNALENNDYDAWKLAMDEQYADATTEDAFKNTETRYEQRGVFREERDARRTAMDAALDARDYDAWLAVVDDMNYAPRFEVLSEDDFNTLADMHEARQAGDYETADQLRDELGLPEMGEGMGEGMHGGFGEGFGNGFGGMGGHNAFGAMGDGFGDGGCMR